MRRTGWLVLSVSFVVSGLWCPLRAGAQGAVPGDRAAGAAQDYDRRPDAALIGLSRLGVVVEGLTAQAAACGIRQDALEAAAVKQLTAAGFKVVVNADEESYVYVNVMTASLPSGVCVSRYDASIYTHTTARLSYGTAPAPVEVSLLHKGGIAGSAAAVHGDAVSKGVQDYLEQFITRIRAAGK